MKPNIALFLAILVCCGACLGDGERLSDPDDYIVFGDFYGECIGQNCVDIYKISSRMVFEDTLDIYPQSSKLPHTLSFVSKGGDRFDALNELVGEIPGDLFEESDIVIGQPDAGDWGGFYLETNVSGEVRYWLIDKMEENLPRYLRSYVEKLETAVHVVG